MHLPGLTSEENRVEATPDPWSVYSPSAAEESDGRTSSVNKRCVRGLGVEFPMENRSRRSASRAGKRDSKDPRAQALSSLGRFSGFGSASQDRRARQRDIHDLVRGVSLHALSDRLTVQEVAQLGAPIPMLIRGFYYEGWVPSETR